MLPGSSPVRELTLPIALAIALSSACSGYGLLGTERHQDGQELNLMTFNIRYGTADDGPNSWPQRRDLVVQVLQQNDADVVALQEALHFQLQEICQSLPHYA